MNMVVIVTSVIMPESGLWECRGGHCSKFSASERLIQTVATLHSLTLQLPEAKLIMVDGSDPDYGQWLRNVFPAVTYLHLKSLDPKAAHEVRNSGSKTIGECRLMLTCWHHCQDLLLNADFILKASGRYMFENLRPADFDKYDLGAYLFPPVQPSDIRDWRHPTKDWEYSLSTYRRPLPEKRIILPTILYGWGCYQTVDHFMRLERILLDMYKPEYYHYDIENLLAREVEGEPVTRTDWKYLGWNGESGNFLRF